MHKKCIAFLKNNMARCKKPSSRSSSTFSKHYIILCLVVTDVLLLGMAACAHLFAASDSAKPTSNQVTHAKRAKHKLDGVAQGTQLSEEETFFALIVFLISQGIYTTLKTKTRLGLWLNTVDRWWLNEWKNKVSPHLSGRWRARRVKRSKQ